MLQIKGIRKIYKTGALVQEALKDVSLSLRDCEFVAVLGQSGSGKTTLLNIIGGLDRYDEGDLIINGVSTRRYSDRDWDSYRNHTVGFVFQSYNLIPHQTILKNVELALTIGGVSAKERALRASEALRKVGLEDHIHKKPSQLSGGQMQRVAIARALVNDPDILLADEPTGALDSETSLQVMDLLKEVARDRLVVMVTHNPELAEKYATRIVNLKDGQITSDSNPFTPEEGQTVHKNLGKSSMSLLTSLLLSFNNLWTKKARTILVSFAGSIGIIGIALILSMSHGANQYIRNVEEDSLKDYPLMITDTSFNLASMYASGMLGTDTDSGSITDNSDKPVKEWGIVTDFLSGISSNDLKSLKAYFQSDECDIDNYVQTIDYDYNVTPLIYKKYGKSIRQVNPSNSFEALGFSSTDSGNSLLSTFSNTNIFFPMPETQEMMQKNYEIKAGKWPENYNECVVTLTSSGRITDVTLFYLGLKDPKKLDEMINAFVEGEDYSEKSDPVSYNYEDFLNIEFKLLPSTSLYTYDKDYEVWTDHSGDDKYIKKQLKNAETLKIVGVAQPISDSASTDFGIAYPASLTKHVIELAADSDIVKAQLKKPEVDVFTGKRFDDESEQKDMDMSSLFSVDKDAISKVFSFDGGQLDFSDMDLSGIDFTNLDLSSSVSPDDLSSLMPQLSSDEIKELLDGIRLDLSADTMKELFEQLLKGYEKYSSDDKRADLSNLPASLTKYLGTDSATDALRKDIEAFLSKHSEDMITEDDVSALAESVIKGYTAWLVKNKFEADDDSRITEYLQSEDAQKDLSDDVSALRDKLVKLSPTDEEINAISATIISGYESFADANELPSASYLLTSFVEYLSTDEAKELIMKTIDSAVDTAALEEVFAKYADIVAEQMSSVTESLLAAIGSEVSAALQEAMASLSESISDNLLNAFNFDSAGMADMFKMKMSPQELRDLITSLLSPQKSSYESNLRKMGYADLDNPSTITIYPTDFDSKIKIKHIIEDYNQRAAAAGEDEKVIKYTDLVDALMETVTTIINAISYVLIAFVAVSLVVSSIMIGVITYISVLERKKEIGILRAIGASKHNISQVFNAETFIIGALAGIFGIGITSLLIIPANAILHALTGQENINAILPPEAALILILLSIVLTLIGGIIPSRKAAKSDPVAALRSE